MNKREQITTCESLKLARAFGYYVREQLDARILFPDHLRDQLVCRAAELELATFDDLRKIVPEFPESFEGASVLTESVFLDGQDLESFCDLLEFSLGVSLDSES